MCWRIGVHWLALTVHCSSERFYSDIWEYTLFDLFGSPVPSGVGGRGYQDIHRGLSGIQLYTNPREGDHCHLVLPGDACDCITPGRFRDLLSIVMSSGYRWSITRVDFAIDGFEFTPRMFYDGLVNGSIVTKSHKNTIRYIESPFEVADTGRIGTSTVYSGSRESERFLRVYDRRGKTRIEIQFSGERALPIALDIIMKNYSDWMGAYISHILAFIDVEGCNWLRDEFSAWQQSYIIIRSSRVVKVDKIKRWMEKQVCTALALIERMEPEVFNQILFLGHDKLDRSRYYKPLLQMAGLAC